MLAASKPTVHWGWLTAAFSVSIAAWIWAARIARSRSNIHLKQKNAIFAWKTDHDAFGFYESAKSQVKQWNYISLQ